MHILTVLDHPDPNSLSHAVAARFGAGARSAGHTIEMADLHADGFNPAWSMADVAHGEGGPVPADVRKEQIRIEQAQALCLVFPLYWYSMPAMMKGWIDRVWSWGWAYDQLDVPEKSLQPQRPTAILIPAGASSDEMEQTGIHAALDLFWNQGTFGYFGMSPRQIHVLHGSTGSQQRREGLLARAEEAGRTIGAPQS